MITLTAWADDRTLMLWTGDAGRDFGDDTLASFRAWLDTAERRRK